MYPSVNWKILLVTTASHCVIPTVAAWLPRPIMQPLPEVLSSMCQTLPSLDSNSRWPCSKFSCRHHKRTERCAHCPSTCKRQNETWYQTTETTHTEYHSSRRRLRYSHSTHKEYAYVRTRPVALSLVMNKTHNFSYRYSRGIVEIDVGGLLRKRRRTMCENYYRTTIAFNITDILPLKSCR
jgi:hypothetical protein